MKKSGLKRIHEAEELNITAFMNLMVILVPFLLITAVFSRMTVLELNLPALDAKDKAQEKVELQLELVLREARFDIQDANLGIIKSFPRGQAETRWDLFTDLLVEIKNRFPEYKSITLLLEQSINYKNLIQVMDSVRYADLVAALSVETIELFPDISIGDAPAEISGSKEKSEKK